MIGTATPDLFQALASSSYWLAGVATVTLVALSVVLHFEGMDALSRSIGNWRVPTRARMVLVVFFLIGLHSVEIWMFGIGIHGLSGMPGLQAPRHLPPLKLLDTIYLSAITYTTVGYGDLVPHGPLRLVLASEALTGLVMITWSASFTYLEMERYWRPQRRRRERRH
ncbi:two pore domain potassium channel family protein [Solimonas fluminis]|uniref:Two pore domain potassium channel family protein n=1 Tax=Solimonas fluminis TaxID=2086571 RepID=A0A2S5TEG2_9GAMM|nr:potassium channel family protein [Solimonas fluminis]PPE73376.1 two pore domain potassium channel family protein [Solimonas fluminis]